MQMQHITAPQRHRLLKGQPRYRDSLRPDIRKQRRIKTSKLSSFHATSVQQLTPHLIYSTKAFHGPESWKQPMWIHGALQRAHIMYKPSGGLVYHLIFYVLGLMSALTHREVATTQKWWVGKSVAAHDMFNPTGGIEAAVLAWKQYKAVWLQLGHLACPWSLTSICI